MARRALPRRLAEPGRIPAVQLLFLAWFIRVSTIICLHPEQKLAPGAPFWASTLLPAALALVLVPLYGILAGRFPNRSIIQIGERVFGTVPGKLVGLLLLLYFVDIARLDTRIFSDMMQFNFLRQTPPEVVMASMLLVLAWGAWSGLEVLGRSVLALALFIIPALTGIIALSSRDLDLQNLWPLTAEAGVVFDAAVAPLAMFGELVVVLMLHPFLSRRRRLRRVMVLAIAGNAAVSTLVLVWSVGLLGAANATATVFPTIQIARQINIAEFIQRIEGLMILTWVGTWFAKSGLFLYAAALGLAHLTGGRDHRVFVPPLALLIAVGARLAGDHPADLVLRFAPESYGPLGFGLGFGLPLLLLAVAALRRLPSRAPDTPRSEYRPG